MPRILVIQASFGQGHKQAALAISSYFGVPCHDLINFAIPGTKKIQAFAYLYITKNFPLLWKLLYDTSENKIIEKALNFSNKLIYWSFIKYIKQQNPDLIITTHFFPPQILRNVQKKMKFKLISIVTDIKPHPQWASSNVDQFFVPTKQSKKWLIELGVKGDKIIDGYVSVRAGFLKEYSILDLYKKFNLNPAKKTILFMSLKNNCLLFFIKNLKTLQQKFNLIIIYGKNKKLKNYLDKSRINDLIYFSFYQKMWELISMASLIIAKPGGLTTFEGGYKKKLFIFTHFIPGQEEENMNLLKKYGIAKFASKLEKIPNLADELLEKEKSLQEDYPLKFKDIRQPLTEIINSHGQDS